ncbi:MAG: alginate export family protein [FCB group bacterium]|jgi:hypothetical protein|nr:alginate export family protein [FCB group bacterium]
MRKLFVILAVLTLVAVPAMAELQNVTVGGSIQIRANYYMSAFGDTPEVRWPNRFNVRFLPVRAVGNNTNFGVINSNADIFSPFDWNDKGNDLDIVEQRTRLNVNADFTDEVSAFIELDSYDTWGEDFRSNYVTGADFAPVAAGVGTTDDVEIYQAYIQAEEMWGTPLRLRVGRQELSFGSEFLVGTNDTNSFFTGLSFDGIRATYGTDMFSVDAWAAKLNEVFAFEEDGDTDFYGVYGSYTGMENISIDAYWMLVRDAAGFEDTPGTWLPEWIENWLGVDDYDPTYLHTVGLRGAGTVDAFDFEAEFAYQFGDADQVGRTFRPFGFTYADNDADFDGNWAVNGELGYTFDMNYQPRVFVGGAYFTGEDNRDVSVLEWLNPFDMPEASVGFNRLFSNWEYSQFLDTNADMSNFWAIRAGVSAKPTESVEVMLKGTYLVADEAFDAPRHIKIGRYRVPVQPRWSFWTTQNDEDLGIEAELSAKYNYSEDLVFEAGWAHLFVDDGLKDGSFTSNNGLVFNGGTSDDDADYVYVETRLSF